MIEITPELHIKEDELQFEFIRASGPGGQNVNKVASAVQLRFDTNSASLSPDVRARLKTQAGGRITESGVLVIEAKEHRTQTQNRDAALQRFVRLIQQAAKKPKVRRKTRPTAKSKLRRLEAKRQRSRIKRLRRKHSYPDE